MFRWLLALLLLLALAVGGAYVVAGRGAPPQLDHRQAGSLRRPGRHARRDRRGAERALHRADHRARAERQDACRCSRSTAPQTRDRRRTSIATHLQIVAAARQAERARASVRRRAHRRHRDAAVVPEPAQLTSTASEGLPGPARAAAHRRALDAPLREPRRLGDGRLQGDAARRRVGRARRRRRVSRASRRRAPVSTAPIRRSRSRSSRCSTISR